MKFLKINPNAVFLSVVLCCAVGSLVWCMGCQKECDECYPYIKKCGDPDVTVSYHCLENEAGCFVWQNPQDCAREDGFVCEHGHCVEAQG